MKTDIDPTYTQFIVVQVSNRNMRPDIKRFIDLEFGLPSQFVVSSTISKCVDGNRVKLGPFGMILK